MQRTVGILRKTLNRALDVEIIQYSFSFRIAGYWDPTCAIIGSDFRCQCKTGDFEKLPKHVKARSFDIWNYEKWAESKIWFFSCLYYFFIDFFWFYIFFKFLNFLLKIFIKKLKNKKKNVFQDFSVTHSIIFNYEIIDL